MVSRSQAQIVGYIALAAAITGIAIGVYFWGTPIVQKNTVTSSINSIENSLTQLAKTIEDSGMKGISQSYTMSYNGQLNIEPNKISLSINIPIALYTTNLHFIPINYKYLFMCDKNTTVYSGQSIYLCGNKQLIATLSGGVLTINDTFYGKSIQLPANGYYHNIIAQVYVFDIKCDGTKCRFFWKNNIGYTGVESTPACTVNAYVYPFQKGENVNYVISCRPVLDPETHKCIWIQIQPTGASSVSGSGSVTFSINYDSSKLVDYSKKSTVCKYMEYRTVDISLS